MLPATTRDPGLNKYSIFYKDLRGRNTSISVMNSLGIINNYQLLFVLGDDLHGLDQSTLFICGAMLPVVPPSDVSIRVDGIYDRISVRSGGCCEDMQLSHETHGFKKLFKERPLVHIIPDPYRLLRIVHAP